MTVIVIFIVFVFMAFVVGAYIGWQFRKIDIERIRAEAYDKGCTDTKATFYRDDRD